MPPGLTVDVVGQPTTAKYRYPTVPAIVADHIEEGLQAGSDCALLQFRIEKSQLLQRRKVETTSLWAQRPRTFRGRRSTEDERARVNRPHAHLTVYQAPRVASDPGPQGRDERRTSLRAGVPRRDPRFGSGPGAPLTWQTRTAVRWAA